MFEKKNKSKSEESVIAIKSNFEGNLKIISPVYLRIEGGFKGELEVKGRLDIGQEADVEVNFIRADNIMIMGKVKGDIKNCHRLELAPGAMLIGNIETLVLVVQDGAFFQGRCQVLSKDG